MEDQDKLMNEIDIELSLGKDIEGMVLSKTSDGIIISLKGYGLDGIIPKKELTNQENLDEIFNSLNKDDVIKARVIKYRNDDGYVVLSRLEYEKDSILDELEALFLNKTNFNLNVSEEKEKGLVGYYKGIRVFIPASQIDIRFVNNKKDYVNKELEVRLIEFNRDNISKIIASSRVILEEEKKYKEEALWSSINVGDIVKAEIKRFSKFGVFADINGVDGLIHLSQIAWTHVKKAEDFVNVGDIIDVKVIGLDKENNKISLSIKELTPEPWQNINEKYPEGTIVLGKVVRINDFGAFVELEPGVDGLVHISKISHDRINHPSDALNIGDEIKAKIISIEKDKKRIGLSIKDTL